MAERFHAWPVSGALTAGQALVLAEALSDEKPKPKTAREKLRQQPKLSKAKLVEIARRREPAVKTAREA